jgi:LacI family transcriptional regulator, galactose operon repressor
VRTIDTVSETPRKPSAAVTIVDVARAAKVSRATASRALAGYGRIGAATQQRVREVAEQLGYRPNTVARAMRAGKTATIGLVVTDVGNSFFAQATKAIAATAARMGYEVLVADTDHEVAAEQRAIRVFTEKRVDGLIVVPATVSEIDHLRPPARGESRPLVLLDRRLPGDVATSVTSDDFRAAADVVAALAAKGHVRIGMIDGNSTRSGFARRRPRELVSAAVERIEGFRTGMRAAGLSVEPGAMLYAQSSDPEGLRRAVSAMLDGEGRPSAVVANNSDVALAILVRCRELRLKVGRDVSLVSFDDTDWARAFSPPISTVSRPVAQMGRMAVRELVAQIAGEPPSDSIVLPNKLVVRDSVARLRSRHLRDG